MDIVLNELIYSIRKEHDSVIEQCFLNCGFDMEYLISHRNEFLREVHPEFRETYYHLGNPLFSVVMKNELSPDGCRYLITHHVEYFREGEEA